MPRPAFTVVSSTVLALVVLGFVAKVIKPVIPPPAENELSRADSEFLRRAATQKVSWKQPLPESFAAARRRDRPIFLFIGNSYNPLARGVDRSIQLSTRVQSYLSRNFECIRVDHLAFPAFRNAFLPISRSYANLQPGCQLWVLEPAGGIVDLLPFQVGLNPTNDIIFIDALVDARQKFENFGKVPSNDRYELAQQKDLLALSEMVRVSVPPFEEYSALVSSAINARGGFGNESPRILSTEPWRYLLAIGETEAALKSINPVLESPMVDLIDGGFFQGSRDPYWIEVEYDKSATTNASMLRVLMSASLVAPKPIFRYLATRTFDSLYEEFVTSTGFAAARSSDAINGRRSLRASFGVRRLREALADAKQHQFAQEKLGLRVETNPQMTPRLSQAALDDSVTLSQVLAKLAKTSAAKPECGSIGFADVTGFTVARMIEAAKLMDDPRRLDQATELLEWVESNRRGPDIMRSQSMRGDAPYAGDYLAYADAALEHYLATGRYSSINDGKEVLTQALNLFSDQTLTKFGVSLPTKSPMPTAVGIPELTDASYDSCVSLAIRLCHRYGSIFNSEPRFRQFANGATGSFGSIAQLFELRSAAYFTAAQEVFEDVYFVTVGKRAQEMADELSRAQPFRLVFPAFGEIRTDVQSKGPGVYLVRAGQISAPMTLQEAKSAISPFLGKSD